MIALTRCFVIVMLALAVPKPGTAQEYSGGVTFGLSGVSDFSTQHPFIDIMRTAREWIGHLPDQWGGWTHAELESGGYLDADGWLTALPDELDSVGLLFLVDLPEEAGSFEGRYRLTFDGQGEIELRGRRRVLGIAEGERRFHFSPGKGLVELRIHDTDPEGTGDYIRNIRIIKEDHIADFEAGERFNPSFLERLEGARGLRYLDWMRANDSEISQWQDRPRIEDYTWARIGVPLEILIELANRLGADPWFTLPHLADDDYMRRFAQTVHADLDPGLRAYVEFSNEVWNWQFTQASWAGSQGEERWGRDDAWVQYYAKRASEMVMIWDEVYGDESEDRLVKVLATQTGWPGLEEYILEAPLWVAESSDQRAPHTYFDAYAVTGYFDGALGRDGTPPTVLEWIAESREAAEAEADARGLQYRARDEYIEAHQFDLASDIAAMQIRDGAITGTTKGSLRHLLDKTLPYHARVAEEYGLDLVMYEGGTHIVGVGEWVEEEALTEFFTHLNYTGHMGMLYDELLEGWAALTDAPFNAYFDIGAPSRWGSWGALRHLDDDNPRWRALMRHARQ